MKNSPRLFGVDYSENLINIAEKNLACINASKVKLINHDVIDIDANLFKKTLFYISIIHLMKKFYRRF